MSKIRIRNNSDKDIVTIDMHDGRVEIHHEDQVDDAARSFWDAVAMVRRSAPHTGDFVFREPDAPLVTVVPGRGANGGHGGDVIIHPGPGDLTVTSDD